MAYSNQMVGIFPPPMKWQGPQYKKQAQRSYPRSQPFDADDLRRRLNAVIAEREAHEYRQRAPSDGSSGKRAHGERELHSCVDNNYTISTMTKTTRAVSEATAQAERPSKLKAKPSLQDRLRHKAFSPAPAPAVSIEAPTAYRHMPDQAAIQFSRTTSGTSHRFSAHYPEPTSTSHREEVESASKDGKRRSLLQRARGHREPPATNPEGDDGLARRRSYKARPRPGEATRVDGEGISAVADLHLHTYPSHGQRVGDDGELQSSEDTLVDPSRAHEHRVDWTQRDEMPPREKKSMRFHPLLQKTTSMLGLRGRLGRSSEKNKVTVVTVPENPVERADDVDADDGSTPVSPNSYSGRANVWGRLRRG